MLPRIIAPFLAAAALVFACGPRTPNTVSSARPTSAHVKTASPQAVTSVVIVDTSGATVRFAIEVANGTRKRVELDFPNGRTHDFIVRDETGREVWRWSEGRLFTQAMQNRLLDSHDAVVYAESWRPSAKGRFTLEAHLHSENYPVQQRVEFALR